MTGRKLKTKVFSILITMVVVLLMEGSVMAKAPEFRLDMDSLNIEKGTSSNLVLSIVNADDAEVIDIKGLENFDVVSKSTSTSTQIINGDITNQVNYNYVIIPKSTGKFTLKGNVKYNGTTYETNELQVNVGQGNNNNTNGGEAKDLFIKTSLSSNTVYLGQKVALSYDLFSHFNIEDCGFTDTVNIKDFISKEIPKDKLKSGYTYINGDKYLKYEAKQIFLSPIKVGTFSIPDYNYQVNVSTGDFFNSSRAVYLKTDPLQITVKPLPQDNKPADFSGIVGKLKIEANYSKQEVNYGDSITLQINASGNCNLDDVKKIVKDDIPGFSVYQTQKSADESIENGQYTAKKEFEIILVPSKTGDVKIDPMYISYFNPESGKYEKAEISGTTIKVNGEIPKAQSVNGNAAPKVESVKIDQVDYKPLNEGYLTIQFKKEYLFAGLTVFVILLIAAALIVLMFLYRKKQDKVLQGIYRQINNANNQNDIYNLFNNMMKHCFNLSIKASSKNDIKNRLAGQKVAGQVAEIMDYMEDERRHSDKEGIYLKGKIKEIYRLLRN